MTLRSKVIVYLVVMHSIFAVIALVLVRNRLWLLAVEAVLLLSILIGARLARAFSVPTSLIETGAQLIDDGDFAHTFQPVSQPEMDRLIAVYNRMILRLREERLRAEEQHFFLDKILGASPTGVLTCDLQGRVATVNPSAARLLQRPRDELEGRRLDEISSPLAAHLAALEVDASRVVTVHGRRRLRCQRAQFLAQGFARDLYVLEELTEELRRSERHAYETVIRMMSHEVNNSVAAISSLLQTGIGLAGELPAPNREPFQRALAVAIARSDHLRSFMEAFAEVVRLPTPEPRPCDLIDLLDDILVLLGPELAERRVEWMWAARHPLPPIDIDKNQMEQVFINLLRNAAEATGEGGTITLRALAAERRATVIISDDGPGIAPEVRERLFTPFFSTKSSGCGIGLTLVQEVLTRHGFDFSLEGPKGGPTSFTIWF